MSNPEQANKEKALGNDAFQKQDYGTALEHYEKAVELNPNDHVHFSNRSGCFAMLEEYEKALEDATKCIQIKPDWAKGYSRKGLAEYHLGKYEQAESTYKRGLEIDPNNAQCKEGVESVKKAQEGGGMPDFGNFSAFPGGAAGGFDPNNQFMQQVFLKLLMNPETQGYLSDPQFMAKIQAIQKNPQLISTYMGDPKIKKAFEVISQDIPQNFDPSKFKFPKKDDAPETKTESPTETKTESKPETKPEPKEEKKAEPAPTKEAKEPKHEDKEPTISDEHMHDHHHHHDHDHSHHHHHHDHKQTKAEHKHEPKPTPTPHKAVSAAEEEKNKGNDEYKKRNFTQAIVHYDKAIELDPKEVIYYNNKAAVYLETKEYDKAHQCCDTAIELCKSGQYDFVKLGKVLARKASVYAQQEKYEDALKCYHASLLENGDNKVKEEMKKIEKLKKEKDASDYINPEISEQHRQNGNKLYGEGKYPDAIKEYDEAIKRNPKDAKLYANKATALMKLLEHPSALIEINKCLDLDPNYVKGWAKRGVIHHTMKEYHKALECFEKGLKIEPDNEECKKGMENTRGAIMMGSYTETKEEAEERLRHGMADPEIQNILRDPSVNEFLRNVQEKPNDPSVLGAMRDPTMSAKINKLIAAGVLKTG